MNTTPDSRRFTRAVIITLAAVIVLTLIRLAQTLGGYPLHEHGIYPRDPGHLTGILSAPLVHGSWSHLATNATALLVLLSSALYGYPRAIRFALPLIWIGSGVGVWLFARTSFHYGASGITFGLMFFTFTIGALRWDPRASALSMLVFFLYGGMIWGIFPGRPGISFEYHFFGAAAGVLCAVALRRLDPPPPQKRYSWEGEEEDDSDPYWLTGTTDAPAQTDTRRPPGNNDQP